MAKKIGDYVRVKSGKFVYDEKVTGFIKRHNGKLTPTYERVKIERFFTKGDYPHFLFGDNFECQPGVKAIFTDKCGYDEDRDEYWSDFEIQPA